ncbi:MAG: hypothetical protein QOF09_2468 [Alphaproteobacteria bacterium]|jgi:hypothetical protein|nr:hypothetical protein [Alphaproteobacteria bacterium]
MADCGYAVPMENKSFTLNGAIAMRILMAPAIVALLIQPAYSQRWGQQQGNDDRKVEQERKELERQHKATLDRIPDQKKKNSDPWQTVRGTDSPKKKAD